MSSEEENGKDFVLQNKSFFEKEKKYEKALLKKTSRLKMSKKWTRPYTRNVSRRNRKNT